MRKPLVAANWKMHGSREMTRELIGAVRDGLGSSWNVDVLICPPYVYLDEASRQLDGSGIALGAQHLNPNPAGAHTGEVSASMLADLGCSHVIVGHSERRAMYGDDDAVVAANFCAAQDASLTPVLCVGESLEERDAGITNKVVCEQVQAVIDAAGIGAFAGAVLAYEPVWAIGTGRTATPEQAQDVHRILRELLAAEDDKIAGELQILYGGSVKGDNARALFGMPDIDGGLIGGASLKAEEFLAICEAAGTPV
ncbi:MAG: triose-phosphate isomerase [Gammaproteobacteria bacterium]|nr:triose-phosphate isomerase [Gammaproteobacteria bacterium]NNF61112.1 triose-phosphate isomerase [Gammaproteobacteria bacterium]